MKKTVSFEKNAEDGKPPTPRDLVPFFLEQVYGLKPGRRGLIYTSGQFYKWVIGRYVEIQDVEIKTSFTRWAKSFEPMGFKNTRAASEEAFHHIKTKTILPDDTKKNAFIGATRDGQFVAFNNGVVNIKEVIDGKLDVEVIPHTPNFFNLAKIPYDYNRSGKCPTWLSIISKILPNKEDRDLLQQWFGYHLIPGLLRTKMMFLEGDGANGKSVILFVLRLLLGEENVSSIPLSSFDPDKTFKIASTEGKLANICEEAGQISVRVEEALKQYVAGNAFTVEKKFMAPYQIYPSAKITVATNVIPEFKDKSDGIWRRILYIKFGVKIHPRDQRREFLERDYWLESGELPGILNWAFDGAQSLELKNSFISSERKAEEIQILKMNSDLLRAWVVDNLKIDLGHKQPTTPILQKLKTEMDNGLLPRVSMKEIFREIEAQFPGAKRPANPVTIGGKKVRVMCGIRLVEEHLEQENYT